MIWIIYLVHLKIIRRLPENVHFKQHEEQCSMLWDQFLLYDIKNGDSEVPNTLFIYLF